MRVVAILIILLASGSLFAQDTIEVKLKKLYDKNDFETITQKYTLEDDEHSANSLFYIGTAYMMMGDDENCIKFMDLSIAKDSLNPAPFYTKATSLLYLNRLEEAIPFFKKTIMLESDSLKLAQTYSRLAFAYTELNQTDNALAAYYKAKESTAEDTDEYISTLFNIGLLAQLKGSYKESEKAFNELIKIKPDDYHSYAKLIQIYNHNKEYDKIAPLKIVLYDAYKNKLLDENLSDMFCIDQFKVNGKPVQAFERYEEGDKSTIYNKILFYIIGDDGEIEYRIQTEYSPAAVAFGSGKYMLCANKDGAHINYSIVFDDSTSYETIKKAVISILEKGE